MLIVPDTVEFELMPVGTQKTTVLYVKNEGNAVLNYELVPGFANSEFFQLEIPEGHTKISPGNRKKISLTFSPTVAGTYESKIILKSRNETKDILVKGTGADFKLDETRLPQLVDFGDIQVGAKAEQMITLYNGCNYAMDFELSITLGEALDPHFVTFMPSLTKGTLAPNNPKSDTK